MTEVELSTMPLKHLQQTASDLEKYILYKNGRLFSGWRDNFSWVFGISEVELLDFARIYDDTIDVIRNFISITENKKLKEKLEAEFKFLPTLNANEFILDINNRYWILKIIRPFKTIRKSLKLKGILNDISRTCERMINYIENVEWLELEDVNKTSLTPSSFNSD